MSVVAIAQHRTSGGRFAPGRSGNPAGRPKGARNKTTLLAEAVLEESGETLVQKAVAGALGGDGATLRYLLGRLLPPASGDQPVALDLAPGEESDPAAILAKAVRAMADGEITPKQALQIGRVLAIFAKLKRMSSPSPAKRPVSETPLPLAGEGGARISGRVRAAAERSESALTPTLSRKREREAALGGPVSDLYFSREADKSKRPLPSPPPQAGEGASFEPSPARGGGQRGGSSVSAGEAPVPETPLPLAGEGGARISGRVRATAGRSESAFTPTFSRKREREAALGGPVSALYFSSRPSRSALFSTTAIGLSPGMAGRHGVESPRPGLPI